MADPDPARPWHAGPTVLADVQALSNPREAPRTFRLTREMNAMFQVLRRRSFPGGRSKEQGATIVADAAGRFSLQNIGGLGSTAGTFTPNVILKDPTKYKVVGVFHTHPYDRTEGSMNGVAFSGGDVGALILTDTILSVVQSGPRLFVFVKTALSPALIDYDAAHESANNELSMRQAAGQTFQQASRIIAQGRALQYGLAYYQGRDGVATRV